MRPDPLVDLDDITGLEIICVVGLIVIILGGVGYIALKMVGLL